MIIDLNDILDDAPKKAFVLLPDSIYDFLVDKGIEQMNSKGTGIVAKLQFVVTDGQFKGQRVFEDFNLTNPSQKAVNISRQRIKKLLEAFNMNVDHIDFPLSIVGQIFKGKVETEIGTNGYKDKNKIIEFYIADEFVTPVSTTAPTTTFEDQDIPF